MNINKDTMIIIGTFIAIVIIIMTLHFSIRDMPDSPPSPFSIISG